MPSDFGHSAVTEFLAYVTSEKGLAENTRLAYAKDLDQYLTFCRTRRKSPFEADLKLVRDFVAHLRRGELTLRSIARKVSALKQFYKFLMREGRIESDPSELISIMVRTKRLPKHLSQDEITRLIAAAPGDTSESIRDRAMLEFWYATGARVSELASLKVSQLDTEDRVVSIVGKGGKERLVPLTHDAVKWMERYREIRHEWLRMSKLKEPKVFFLTRTGSAFTRQGIWKIVKKYAKVAKITRNVWPHMIRHSFATHVLQNGADLRAVQELMGHRSVSTTEIYTHLDLENLKLIQLKYHPRN